MGLIDLAPSSNGDNQDCPSVSNEERRDGAGGVNARQRIVQRQPESTPSSVTPVDLQTGHPAAGFQPSCDATSQGSTSKGTTSMPI